MSDKVEKALDEIQSCPRNDYLCDEHRDALIAAVREERLKHGNDEYGRGWDEANKQANKCIKTAKARLEVLESAEIELQVNSKALTELVDEARAEVEQHHSGSVNKMVAKDDCRCCKSRADDSCNHPEWMKAHPYHDPRCVPGTLALEQMCALARLEVPKLMKAEMERTGMSAEDALLIALESTKIEYEKARAEVERLENDDGK